MAETWRDKVVIRQGDITESRTDAIVNAANNELVLGVGVAGAIRKKGGPEIQRECDRIGPISLGDAAITGSGILPAKFVIHAASMELGSATNDENLCASTRNALKRAAERGLTSIAFPAIGTGIAVFPLHRCAQIMLEEVRSHLSGDTSVNRVEFVLYDASALEVFRRRFASMS